MDAEDTKKHAYTKATYRIVPLLMILYGVIYLDRVNVSFARLQMASELGISNSSFGVGVGLFFVGYVLFQVPSNYLAANWGVRRFVAVSLILWGIAASAAILTKDASSFYACRFALGVAESGFFPALILYLTQWFPRPNSGRVMAYFLSGPQIAAIMGGPLAGFVMDRLGGVLHLRGWQWLFLLQGITAVMLGFVTRLSLRDRPRDVGWSTLEEKGQLEAAFGDDRGSPLGRQGFWGAFLSWRTYAFAFVFFSFICCLYVLTFWMPAIIRDVGVSHVTTVGLLSALPPVSAVISMWTVGKLADVSGRPTVYAVATTLFTAAAFALLHGTYVHLWFVVFLLCTANAGLHSAMTAFWATPMSFRNSAEAAAGIAIITSVGALGGLAGPALMGWITDRTGTFGAGVGLSGGLLLIAALVLVATVQTGRGRGAQRIHEDGVGTSGGLTATGQARAGTGSSGCSG